MVESELNLEGMSRRTLVKLMALASSGILSSPLLAGAEQQQAAVQGPTSLARAGSPRLFYNSASLKQIQRMLAADTAADAALKQKGDELLRAEFVPESVAEIGGGQQANYVTPARQIADMGLTLGLLFHLTDNRKYADRLRDALLYYGGYMRWWGPGLAQRIPPWHSVLETALFGLGYSAGYDALRNDLTDADRRAIAGILVRLAVEPILNDWILPGKRIHSLDSMGHNWWGVCVSGAGLCGLALHGDEPHAQSWIDAVDAGYVERFNYRGNVLQNRMRTFEASGPSYEGVNYTNYGVSQYLNYRFAWQNTFPWKKAARIEPLEHIAAYFLQNLYPTSSGFLTVNFDDALPAVDVTETLLLLAACEFSNPDLARYLKLVHSAPRGTLLTILRQFPRPLAYGIAPTSCISPHMGWVTMRSSWEDDATFLAMKSGYTWNHAHADAGSFILFKQGKPLIIDSGTCKYSRPEYSSYYRTSRAHNVILFDGQGQPHEDIDLGCKFPGQMHSLVDGLGIRYVYADATGPMARWFVRNYRHWIWSGDLILIVDDVRAHTAGQMDWLLHYDGECMTDSRGSVQLKNGPAEAVVKMLYPATTISTEMGLADHDPDKNIPYLVFRPDGPKQIQQFVTAICLNPAAMPEFDVQDDPNFLHLTIRVQNAVEELYLSRRAIATPGTECINAGEFTTDAYLLHVRRTAAGTPSDRYFVADGSYLRRSERSLFESLSKINACWAAGDSLQIVSDSEPSSIQIGAKNPPSSVSWNGRTVSATFDRHEKLASLNHIH